VADTTGLGGPRGHREFLGRAVARLRGDERVVGLLLGGSLAHGTPDSYSDVDLYVVVQDRAFDEILDDRDAVAGAVGSPLFAFDVDPVPGGSTDRIVLYEGPDGGPIKFDFMYLKESDFEPAPKWAGCRAGRVYRMGPPFADKYGTDYALSDEVANEALYALFTDDHRVRGRLADLVGSRVQVGGTKLPEESDDKVTKLNVTGVDPA